MLRERSEHKILIGDFNLTLDVDLDRYNTYCNNNRSKEELENLIEQFQLIDVWRSRNPDKREYSWMKNTMAESKASRIDFALASRV